MREDRFTDELARHILGWKLAPGRFIKSGRSWMPRHRFAPLTRLEDAFLLLDHVSATYSLTSTGRGTFSAIVRLGGRTGEAAGEPKAKAISLALARALGIEPNL